MSLHKFADMVASKGRGDDSLLIHMTPDEVQRLQQFAQANGRSLTINPDTGLPEAGMLSDLFKAVAPIALGAFLGPGAFGIAGMGLSAGTAGLITGGITTLATGSLSRGLMAGLGAYGGAGLAEGFANAGANAMTTAGVGDYTASLAERGIFPTLEGGAVNPAFGEEASKIALEAKKQAFAAPVTDRLSAGFKAATADPSAMGAFAKQNFGNIAAAAAPIMAGAMVPTTTKMPENTNPAYIRQKLYDPFTQTYKSLTPVKATDWGSRNFSDAYTNPQTGQMATLDQRQPTPMAGGGIVALAGGGMPSYAEGDLIREAYEKGDYATAGQLITNAGLSAQDVVNQYGLNQAQAADVAKNLGYTGDMSGTQYGAGYGTTVNDLYTNILGRSGEQAGIDYWTGKFGDTIDANELAQFNTAAQAEIAARGAGTGANTGAGLGALITASPYTDQYTYANINDYIAMHNLDAAGIAAAAKQFNVDPAQITAAQNAQEIVSNVYRNTLGRDADPAGLDYWVNQIMGGKTTGQEMFKTFLDSAKANKEIIANPNIKVEDAVKAFSGYKSADARGIADEWVRNTLGREVTDADRKTQWYKDAVSDATNTYEKGKVVYGDFKTYAQQEAAATTSKAINDAKASLAARGLSEIDVIKQTGKTIAELVAGGTNLGLDIYQASQLKAPGAANKFDFSKVQGAKVVTPVVTPTGTYGNATNPGDITTNKDGTVTVQPNIPYRPPGGFSGIGEVTDAYTKGGGSLGYTARAPRNIDEFNQLYNKQTGDSLAAYDYLMGKGAGTGSAAKYPVQSKAAATGINQPYFSEGMRYKPKFLSYGKDGEIKTSTTSGTSENKTTGTKVEAAGTTTVIGGNSYDLTDPAAAPPEDNNGPWSWDVAAKRWVQYGKFADGGMTGYALGGLGSLGSYSDGGRLLKGPGDGVSDSIPATIGQNQRPARLADGEFVIPARIVSELGNGSTDAGAKKLYAMMDRVQRARGKTTGKNKIAANSRADKHLPA